MKNIGNLFVRLFVISLLTFRYFSTIVSLFGAGAAPFFTAPAPAPAPSKPFRRLRLRLRLRLRIPGHKVNICFFLGITFDWNDIETSDRCQSVRLVKTHRMLCNMTYKSIRDLDLG